MTDEHYKERIIIERIPIHPEVDISSRNAVLVANEEAKQKTIEQSFIIIRDKLMKPVDKVISADWSVIVHVQGQDKPTFRMTIITKTYETADDIARFWIDNVTDVVIENVEWASPENQGPEATQD